MLYTCRLPPPSQISGAIEESCAERTGAAVGDGGSVALAISSCTRRGTANVISSSSSKQASVAISPPSALPSAGFRGTICTHRCMRERKCAIHNSVNGSVQNTTACMCEQNCAIACMRQWKCAIQTACMREQSVFNAQVLACSHCSATSRTRRVSRPPPLPILLGCAHTHPNFHTTSYDLGCSSTFLHTVATGECAAQVVHACRPHTRACRIAHVSHGDGHTRWSAVYHVSPTVASAHAAHHTTTSIKTRDPMYT